MPSPMPAPSAANWGYVDLGSEPGSPGSLNWEYKVWVRWSNGETTSRIVNIPRPEDGGDVNVNARIWDTIHSLIRAGSTFRHPDSELPAEPELPDNSGPAPYGPPENPPPDPDDPLAEDAARTEGAAEGDGTRWFPP
jgi:hypothetical protein